MPADETTAAWPLGSDDVVTVDTSLERTTELMRGGEGLVASTSSTPGVTVERIYLNGERLTDVPEELHEAVMDALYDEGYTS